MKSKDKQVTNNTKGIIRKKHKRSYRRHNLEPTVQKKQVEFLSEVSFTMNFKRAFFTKLTKKELRGLYKLGASLYEVGFIAAGGVVR